MVALLAMTWLVHQSSGQFNNFLQLGDADLQGA